jgi:hypothetical protein
VRDVLKCSPDQEIATKDMIEALKPWQAQLDHVLGVAETNLDSEMVLTAELKELRERAVADYGPNARQPRRRSRSICG